MGPRVELDIVIGATKSVGSHEATLFTDDLAKLGPNSEPRSRRPPPGNQSNFIDRAGNWHAALIGIFHLILLA